VCIVDETGTVCREMKVPSHPEDLASSIGKSPTGSIVFFAGAAECGLGAVTADR
jgi:hypothetical protein